jgi:hypothetical protein
MLQSTLLHGIISLAQIIQCEIIGKINNDLKRIWKKVVMAYNLKCYPGIFWEGLRKTTKIHRLTFLQAGILSWNCRRRQEGGQARYLPSP